MSDVGANGSEVNGTDQAGPSSPDPQMAERLNALRLRLHDSMGKATLVLINTPRYRHLSIGDLQHLLVEPMLRDRVVIALPRAGDEPDPTALAGIAFWASVDEATDGKIREQIRNGVFPVRLQPREWNNGAINWLLDVVAPNRNLATAVIAGFREVLKGGDLRLHPVVRQVADPEILKKMGATEMGRQEAPPAAPDAS